MSDRGSFVTQFVYCPTCFEVAKKHLLLDERAIFGYALPATSIIAGFVKDPLSGWEAEIVREVAEGMEAELCHDMRICVITEQCGIKEIIVKAQVNAALTHGGRDT